MLNPLTLFLTIVGDWVIFSGVDEPKRKYIANKTSKKIIIPKINFLSIFIIPLKTISLNFS
jgi:hypothetical protein